MDSFKDIFIKSSLSVKFVMALMGVWAVSMLLTLAFAAYQCLTGLDISGGLGEWVFGIDLGGVFLFGFDWSSLNNKESDHHG